MRVKLRTADAEAGTYDGPALLDAVHRLISTLQCEETVRVHDTDCQSGCPVGPRMDMVRDKQHAMYFRRRIGTGLGSFGEAGST